MQVYACACKVKIFNVLHTHTHTHTRTNQCFNQKVLSSKSRPFAHPAKPLIVTLTFLLGWWKQFGFHFHLLKGAKIVQSSISSQVVFQQSASKIYVKTEKSTWTCFCQSAQHVLQTSSVISFPLCWNNFWTTFLGNQIINQLNWDQRNRKTEGRCFDRRTNRPYSLCIVSYNFSDLHLR